MNLGVFVSSYVYIYVISLIHNIHIFKKKHIRTIIKCLIPFAMMIRRDPQSEPLQHK